MPPVNVRAAPATTTELILVIDDEPEIRSLLGQVLANHGFAVTEAGDASGATAQLEATAPDLVVLDLGLPDRSGLEVLRDIRKVSGVPVIVLTGRGEEIDRVVGLELGADDYVVKPVSGRELVARIRAVLRRGTFDQSHVLTFDGLTIDLDSRDVLRPDGPATLTAREFDLLAFLARSPRQVFSIGQLLMHVWHTDPSWQDRSTVAEHVYRVRRKIDPAPDGHSWIGTVRNSGYRFEP